jgi:hypothetical protein
MVCPDFRGALGVLWALGIGYGLEWLWRFENCI